MAKEYIKTITYSVLLIGLFTFPTITIAQQTMTREERIKALERLKMEEEKYETSQISSAAKNIPADIEKMELPPYGYFLMLLQKMQQLKRHNHKLNR